MKYNQKLLDTLAERFEELAHKINTPGYVDSKDIYSLVASIMYDRPYGNFDTGYREFDYEEMRNLAKNFLLPIVVIHGGLMDDLSASGFVADKRD